MLVLRIFPIELNKLVDAYIQSSSSVSDVLTPTYWERRHDATGLQWDASIRREPKLAVYSPYCPIESLLKYDYVDHAVRLLLQNSSDVTNALRMAAIRGHVAFIEAFRTNYALKPVECRDCAIPIINHAAAFGHVSVLKELRLYWRLGKIEELKKRDAQARNTEVIQHAAENGHVSILHELRTNWGLDANDARMSDNYALYIAARKGHVHVLRELRLNWGLTQRDFNNVRSGYSYPDAVEAELALFPA